MKIQPLFGYTSQYDMVISYQTFQFAGTLFTERPRIAMLDSILMEIRDDAHMGL